MCPGPKGVEGIFYNKERDKRVPRIQFSECGRVSVPANVFKYPNHPSTCCSSLKGLCSTRWAHNCTCPWSTLWSKFGKKKYGIFWNIHKINMKYLSFVCVTKISSWKCLCVCKINTDFQFSSVAQLCPTLCNPMNRSMPGLPVHHQLLEFTQPHVHQVGTRARGLHLNCTSPPSSPIPLGTGQ